MSCRCSIGYVTLQDYMAFMISRETENVRSKDEILLAFKALSAEEKPYLTPNEIYAVRQPLREIKQYMIPFHRLADERCKIVISSGAQFHCHALEACAS